MISLSPQLLIEAHYENHALADVEAETAAQLDRTFAGVELTGRKVAVAVGSRGIDRIAIVAKESVAYFKTRGARPFIIPAMGSHGGATAEGQAEVLASYGVTEQTAGAPIDSSMDTVVIGQGERGTRVHISRAALDADAILLINRIKPHTDFTSPHIGSGLRKMIAIGLGKAEGAFAVHRAVSRLGYETVLLEIAEFALPRLPPLFGLALIEDAHHKLARIESMRGEAMREREPELLAQARTWMPYIPFPEIDVLILDEIGKNISGSGMDPNITGRGAEGLQSDDRRTNIRTIYVRGLTPETQGNAIGVGRADVVSSKLVAEMDAKSTFTNALSAMSPASARTPMHFQTDLECLEAAIRIAGVEPEDARIVRLRNTLCLDRFIASTAFTDEIARRDNLKIVDKPVEWRFTKDGDLDRGADLLG